MEYRRQQLAQSIEQIREKRPAAEGQVTKNDKRTNTVSKQPIVGNMGLPIRKAIEPPESAMFRREMQQGAIPKVKRLRANEGNAEVDDELAQQLDDWPSRQPAIEPSQPLMSFDAAVIRNFLQHAARFCLRNHPQASEADVTELLKEPVTGMYGRRQDPPTDVELAVRTAQKWQSIHEAEAMWRDTPQLRRGSNACDPGSYNIRVSFGGETSGRAATPYVRTIVPKFHGATIEELVDVPRIRPAIPWVFRFSYPGTITVIISDKDGDINAVDECVRQLAQGVNIRRDGGMVEFTGPPTADVSISVEYHDQEFRLRLCPTYVIINERFRMDANGVSKIIQNDEALAVVPDWEIGLLGTQFESTRVRFAEQRARLWVQENDLVLTAV